VIVPSTAVVDLKPVNDLKFPLVTEAPSALIPALKHEIATPTFVPWIVYGEIGLTGPRVPQRAARDLKAVYDTSLLRPSALELLAREATRRHKTVKQTLVLLTAPGENGSHGLHAVLLVSVAETKPGPEIWYLNHAISTRPSS